MRLTTLATRGLAARPLRSALAIVGIALGVAVVSATLVIGASSEAAVRAATADLLGTADVRLRAFADAGFGPRTLQELRADPAVVAAAPVSERLITVSSLSSPDEPVVTVLVIGVDPVDEAAIREPRLVAGENLSPDEPNGALVPAGWADAHGLELGDELLLSGQRPGLDPLRIVGLMADSGFGALSGGDVVVAGRETLDAAFEVPSPVRYIDLDLGDDPIPATVDAVTSGLDEPYVIETAEEAAARFDSARREVVGVAILFGLVAVVVAAFLVGNTLAMTVGERQRELGLLRAVGATSRQVLGIVVRQALILGAAGSAIGVVAGIGLAAFLVWLLAATRAILVVGLPLPLGGLLGSFVLGVAITLVGAALPAWRAARTSPLDAARPRQGGETGTLGSSSAARPGRAGGRACRDRAPRRRPARSAAGARGHLPGPAGRRRPGGHVPAGAARIDGGAAVRVVLRGPGPAGAGEPVPRPSSHRAHRGHDDDRARRGRRSRHGGGVGAGRHRRPRGIGASRRPRHPRQPPAGCGGVIAARSRPPSESTW